MFLSAIDAPDRKLLPHFPDRVYVGLHKGSGQPVYASIWEGIVFYYRVIKVESTWKFVETVADRVYLSAEAMEYLQHYERETNGQRMFEYIMENLDWTELLKP